MKIGQLCYGSLRGLLLMLLLLSAPAAWADGVLYFADIFYPTFSDGHLYSVKTDGSELQTILTTGGGLRALAIDRSAEKLYWTDVDDDVIRRANLDGRSPEDLISSGLSWPMAIGLDPAADFLCWGDQVLEQIGHAHLDGSGAALLIPTSFASGLAIDEVHGHIYWSESIDGQTGYILRANLDGTDITTVVSGTDKPARIALDVTGGKVYWTDYVVDVVRRANLDGSQVEDLYIVGANLNPDGIAVDPAAGKVYWGQAVQTNRQIIMRMDLDGSNPEEVLTGNFGIITDLTLVTSTADAPVPPAALTIPRGAWPNPGTRDVAIALHLSESRIVRASIHAIDGRRIATLPERSLAAGTHELAWDARNDHGAPVAGGVYYCRIQAGAERRVTEVVISR